MSSLNSKGTPWAAFQQWLYTRNMGSRLTTLLFFLPPALVLFTLFVAMPISEAIYYSFFKWKGLTAISESGEWRGWGNYLLVLKHSVFHTAVLNTLKLIAVSLCIQLPVAMAIALMVAEQGRLNSLFRLIYFLPFILADVVAGLIWRYVYDGDYGLVGQISRFFGSEGYYPLADKNTAFNAILLVTIWKYTGYHMMIYIAGLQGIPKDLLEAAKLDGASRWQTIIRIKLPLIKHAIQLSVFFSIIGALQFFEMVIPLTNGGPANSSHTIVTYLYQYGIVRMRVGLGSSVGVMLFVACVMFAFMYQKFIMTKDD
ncbi:carbohydrate ABC transporter permease [Gynuella sp.]|uniref:carbohydrate ABC transporter permease n=1 Tax=Gynuella sp. TaxID=2969146 RepID=UPI003D0A1301